MVTRYRQQPLRSTGQAGISGRTTKDRIQLFQGFIQPFIVTAPAAPEYLRIEVYPNPFYQDLHLEMAEDAGSVLITITDMTGRTLLKHEAEPRARHLLQPILPAGTYILQVRSVRGSFSTKIIKH